MTDDEVKTLVDFVEILRKGNKENPPAEDENPPNDRSYCRNIEL